MNKELKPCPFCGSTDIRYSLKITGHFDVRYHASMYCNKCHCYGARTLTTVVKNDDYKGRTTIENDETVKQKAIDAWNERTGIKSGKWQKSQFSGRGGFYSLKDLVCSECKVYSTFVDDSIEHPMNYCPNCGAKMNGREINDN